MSATGAPLTLENPLGIEDARVATQTVAEQRRTARKNLEEALADLAQLECDYRFARARAYANNVDALSAGARDAQVDADTADARYRRDLQKAVVEGSKERLAELDGERASLHRLIEFSIRLIGDLT